MVVKTGVSLPDSLYARLQELAASMGYSSISRAIRDAVEIFIAFNSWWNHRGRLRGVIVVAAAGRERLPSQLLRVIERDAVNKLYVEKPSSPEKPYLLYIFVEAEASELKELYKELTRTRGVVMVQPVFVPD